MNKKIKLIVSVVGNNTCHDVYVACGVNESRNISIGGRLIACNPDPIEKFLKKSKYFRNFRGFVDFDTPQIMSEIKDLIENHNYSKDTFYVIFEKITKEYTELFNSVQKIDSSFELESLIL